MTSQNKQLLVILVLITMNSCKKSFLDVTENNITIIRQNYVTDLATTEEYVKGIYIPLSEEFYRGNVQIYFDLAADNMKLAAGQSSQESHYTWNMVESSAANNSNNMNDMWRVGHQISRSCSFVLEKIDEFRSQNPVKADNLKAQALSIRALAHFQLVSVFAQSYNYSSDAAHIGIPVITTSDWTQPVSRNSVADVYTRMIDDLKYAIELFSANPVTNADLLYMNKFSAKALLAKLYLIKGDYPAAKELAVDLANSVPLLTVGNGYPVDLFKSKAVSQTEILFQLSPSTTSTTATVNYPVGGAYTATYTTDFLGRYFINPKRFVATADIALLLTQYSTDARKNWVTYMPAPAPAVWNITKYPQNIVPNFSNTSIAYFQPIFRASEMFLVASESFFQLGDESNARNYVNSVRSRAGIPILSNSISGPALLDSIYLERRRELCFEGSRIIDLLRWKKPIVRIDVSNPTATTLPYPSDKAIAPIPLQDIQIAGLPQNPSY